MTDGMQNGLLENASELLDVIVKRAIINLKKQKTFPSVVVILSEKGTDLLPFSFKDAEEKRMLILGIRAFAEQVNAIGIFVAMDTWIAYHNKTNGPIEMSGQTPPSERPDRKEALVVYGVGNGFRKGIMIPYERTDTGITMLPQEAMGNFDDFNFGNLFENPTLH